MTGKYRSFQFRRFLALAIPMAVALFAALTWPPERTHPLLNPFLLPLRNMEWNGYDTFFNWRGAIPPDPRIVIVGFEKGTWPPPRRHYAALIDRLLADGARVICFDILFDKPSQNIADDQALDAALVRAGKRAILACRINRSGVMAQKSLVFPYYNEEKGIDFERAAQIAFVDIPLDADKIVRSLYPIQKFQNEWLPALPAAAFLTLTRDDKNKSRLTRETIYLGKHPVPRTGPTIPDPQFADNDMGSVYVDFPGGASTFPIYPFDTVRRGEFRRGTFQGKVVFIGVSDIELAYAENDVFMTAFSHHTPQLIGASYTRDVFGVVVQAQMLNALLTNGFIRHASPWEIAALVLFFGTLSTFAVRQFLNWRGPLMVALAILGYIGASFLLFYYLNVYMPFVVPGALLTASTAAVAWLERGELMRKWASSVSPAYLEKMLKTGDDTRPTRYDATIIFGDIRGFTSFSEKHPPERVIDLLDKYLDRQVRIVFEERGTIDKFLGDGILVLFGAPEKLPDAELRAIRAAWRMREASFEPVKDENGTPYQLKAGFGITTGPFVLGFVGSRRQYSLTTIGDTVNLASRLQGVTGEADIIIDRTTYERVRNYVTVEELGPLEIKGKHEKIHCYRITAFHDDSPP